MSKEELYDTFVARGKLLDELLKTTKDNTGQKSIQHIILLGARGIGKTHMLQMIENRVADSTQLRNNWITVKIPEEQYGVFSLIDFFKYILEVILNSSQLENTQSTIYKEELEKIVMHKKKDALDKLVSILKDISKKENRQFLLLVDNIDKILTEKIADEKEREYFRSVLMTEKFMMIIGTSTTVFEEITSYDKAFFRFFKTIHLKNLTDKEVEELLIKRAELDGAVDRIKLNENRTKIRAITDLTGGYPRLVLMLYEILEDKPLLDVLKTFNRLLDNLTPYYQHRMADLSPQQQKIIDEVMLSEGVASPTDIARKVGWKQTVVTSQFKRLKDVNILQVREGETRKRKSYYDISDRLFVIWYQMRYLGVLRERIEYIVTFLKIWYDFEELKDKISRYSDKYQQYYSIGDISMSYDYAKSISIMNCAIANATESEKICIEQIMRYMDIGKFEEALKEAKILLKMHEETGDEKFLARDYTIITMIYLNKMDTKNVMKYAQKALKIYEKINDKKGIASQLGSMAQIFSIGQDDTKKAMECAQKALKIYEEINDKKGIASQLGSMAQMLSIEQDDTENAMEHAQKALKIYEEINDKKGIASQLGSMAQILSLKQCDMKKAMNYARKALKIYEEINDTEGIALQFIVIGIISERQNDMRNAMKNYNLSLKILKDVRSYGIHSLIMGELIKRFLELAIKNNREINIGNAIENIKKLSKCLNETKDEETMKIIASALFNLLVDSEYDFVITILETLQKEHKEIINIYVPFMMSAKYLKTKDSSIFEDKNSLVVDAVKKILEAVENEKKEKTKQVLQKNTEPMIQKNDICHV